MKNTIVLSVIGHDRPGIVDDLSSAIIDNGGNWLESRMCNLAGQFAGVLLVECAHENRDNLNKCLAALEEKGLKVQMALADVGVEANESASQKAAEEGNNAIIELDITGPDHPGIVHDISHFLAEHNINIVEMSSHCQEGAMSGGYIFHSNIIANIPVLQDMSEVENALDDLSDALNVDITLDDLKGSRTQI